MRRLNQAKLSTADAASPLIGEHYGVAKSRIAGEGRARDGDHNAFSWKLDRFLEAAALGLCFDHRSGRLYQANSSDLIAQLVEPAPILKIKAQSIRTQRERRDVATEVGASRSSQRGTIQMSRSVVRPTGINRPAACRSLGEDMLRLPRRKYFSLGKEAYE